MITPPGFICVEKMLNAHSIGIKIVLPMVHASTLQSAEILNNTLPKPGCTDSWTILLWVGEWATVGDRIDTRHYSLDISCKDSCQQVCGSERERSCFIVWVEQ